MKRSGLPVLNPMCPRNTAVLVLFSKGGWYFRVQSVEDIGSSLERGITAITAKGRKGP